MARSRFGTVGVYAGPTAAASVLYTPPSPLAARESHAALTLPSFVKGSRQLADGLFVVNASVVRVGDPEELERELIAYETLRSIARPDLRALKAELVEPTGLPFEPPHLRIERFATLDKHREVPAAAVWALAALLDRMHSRGVAHGCIDQTSVGVVGTPGETGLVFVSPRCMIFSPFRDAQRGELGADERGLRVRIVHAEPDEKTTKMIEGHETALAAMQRDRDGLIDLFYQTLNKPRDSDARVWASLNAETAGTVRIGDAKPAELAKEASEVGLKLDDAEAFARAAQSLFPSGLAHALVAETRAIRAALRSPREVPSGLLPRVRLVANSAKTELGLGEMAEPEAARILAAQISGMMAADRAISEFREHATRTAHSEPSVVDQWVLRLERLEREGSVRGLVDLCNEVAEWSRVKAPHAIEAHRARLNDHFEPGVDVGEALTVFANRTSAYSDEEQKSIVGSCAEALAAIHALGPSILGPFRTGAWDRIRVFVSRQLPDRAPGCDYSATHGLAHRGAGAAKCPPHRYKSGSIEVRAFSGASSDVTNAALHELIHALHLRNERARAAEPEYKRAMGAITALFHEYVTRVRERRERGEPSTGYDTYAATKVDEFFVGVTQVLAGHSAMFATLRGFVELPKRRRELRAHVFVALNATETESWCTVS